MIMMYKYIEYVLIKCLAIAARQLHTLFGCRVRYSQTSLTSISVSFDLPKIDTFQRKEA